jgi:hypothetical protein
MSDYSKGSALRESNLGLRVEKVGVLSADDDLFTCYGPCLVTLMYGIVTTVMDGGASTVALNEKAGSFDIMAATTITNDALNTVYMVSGHSLATANGGLAPTVGLATLTAEHDSTVDRSPALAPMIWSGGSAGITIESTETGDDTGGITWVVLYIPLAEGAYIEAAA